MSQSVTPAFNTQHNYQQYNWSKCISVFSSIMVSLSAFDVCSKSFTYEGEC